MTTGKDILHSKARPRGLLSQTANLSKTILHQVFMSQSLTMGSHLLVWNPQRTRSLFLFKCSLWFQIPYYHRLLSTPNIRQILDIFIRAMRRSPTSSTFHALQTHVRWILLIHRLVTTSPSTRRLPALTKLKNLACKSMTILDLFKWPSQANSLSNTSLMTKTDREM